MQAPADGSVSRWKIKVLFTCVTDGVYKPFCKTFCVIFGFIQSKIIRITTQLLNEIIVYYVYK